MDQGNERRLMVHGEILSIYPLDANWRPVRREYWWKALEAVPLPPKPEVLLVGLGGGTQVHLLYRLSDPRSITVIERDPVIVRVARQWFGLDRVGKLEMVCADAETAIAGLARSGRRFDYVITLCDKVREVCPEFPGDPGHIHWSIADPGLEGDTEEESYPAFQRTAAEIEDRVQFLLHVMADDPTRRS